LKKSNQEKDQLTTLVRLFHSASFFESVTPEGRKKFFAENEEAARGSGKKPSVSDLKVHSISRSSWNTSSRKPFFCWLLVVF
jgi:hypothetical protein